MREWILNTEDRNSTYAFPKQYRFCRNQMVFYVGMALGQWFLTGVRQ